MGVACADALARAGVTVGTPWSGARRGLAVVWASGGVLLADATE